MEDHTETLDDSTLREYLAEQLPGDQMARVEKALRESASLRARLEDVRLDRADPELHTLGAIWRRGRITCPSRQQLGAFLLDALDADLSEYVKFHIEVVACPYCQANLADLKHKSTVPVEAVRARRQHIFESSRHLLASDLLEPPRPKRKS